VFDCAVGARLDPVSSPTLLRLLARVRADAALVYARGKETWRRPRPFAGREVETCVPPAERPGGYSYPSGHSTIGWAWALSLAEIEPDRASQVLARGRSIGESRVVCGVHWESDVEAGRSAGAALFAALSANPVFRADLARARAELARARASSPPTPAQCQAEQGALSTAIYGR
jgi:acid phosphatase (class A)